MQWTKQSLSQACVPEGKRKLVLTDPETKGLVLEIREHSRSFFLRYTFDGKQRTTALGPFPTLSLADARNRAEELKRKVLLGEDPLVAKQAQREIPTFDSFFEDIYQPFSKVHHKRSKAISGLYKNHVGKRFGKKRMSDLTRLMVRQWSNDLVNAGYSAGMINRLMIFLGHLFSVANELQVPGVPRRDELGIKYLKVHNQHQRFLTHEEAALLADAVRGSSNSMLRWIVGFLLMTGARKREALDARWEHINFERGLWFVPVTKSGAPRHIYLSSSAMDLLHELRCDPQHNPTNPLIFPNPTTGKAFQCVFHAWDRARRVAGLPDLRLHDLRHSFASVLVNNGVPIYDVQKLLGHASVKTTQRYAHLSSTTLFKSIAVADQTYGVALGLRPKQLVEDMVEIETRER
jgi:integrase